MSAAIAAILAVALAVLAGLLVPPLLRRRRRRLAFSQALPEPMRAAITRNVPISRALPPDLARRLEGLVISFLAEKQFVGCNGLAITDEIRATIAAQACLLLLGRLGLYDELRSILVYPGAFWVEDEVHDDDGLVTQRRRELAPDHPVVGRHRRGRTPAGGRLQRGAARVRALPGCRRTRSRASPAFAQERLQ